MSAIRVIASGRVQGVGFRTYVKQEAERYAIVGEVWNRPDGTVEMILQHGDSSVLDSFAGMLWDGPGSVDDVERHSVDEDYSFKDFRIKPSDRVA